MAYFDPIRLSTATFDTTAALGDGLLTSTGPLVFGTWTPTFTGHSSAPTGAVARYAQIGKLVIATVIMPNGGTSNAGTFTISAPVTASSVAGGTWLAMGQGVDNSATLAPPCLCVMSAGGTAFSIFKDCTTTATWTSSGAKRASFTIIYEAA